MNVKAHVIGTAVALTLAASLWLVFPSVWTGLLASVALVAWLVALYLAFEVRRLERGERS